MFTYTVDFEEIIKYVRENILKFLQGLEFQFGKLDLQLCGEATLFACLHESINKEGDDNCQHTEPLRRIKPGCSKSQSTALEEDWKVHRGMWEMITAATSIIQYTTGK